MGRLVSCVGKERKGRCILIEISSLSLSLQKQQQASARLFSKNNNPSIIINMIHNWSKWKADYAEACLEYETVWITANKVLYDICTKYPSHREKKEIAAKVWLISRSYMSGIERHSKKGILGIIEFFDKNGKAIDALFASLRSVREPLTIANN
jgi:hypothetical protein